MKLNQLNLTVSDAAETARFLEKYFGLRALEGTEHKKTFAILRDDDGLVLTLIRASKGPRSPTRRPSTSASARRARSR